MYEIKAHIGASHPPKELENTALHRAAPEANASETEQEVVTITEEASAIPRPYELPRFYEQATGVTGIILFSAIIVGSLTVLFKRFVLAFGSITIFMGITMTSFILMQEEGYPFIYVALIAGLFGDALLFFLRRKKGGYAHPLLFCFLFPFVYYCIAFLVLHWTVEVWWSPHMWAGAPFVAGFAGLLFGVVAWKR